MTRDQLASAVGISSATAYRIEVRGHTPRVSTVAALVRVLGLPLTELVRSAA